MSTNELLSKIREFLPEAEIESDLDGQVIIYTGMKAVYNPVTEGDILVRFED
jgi:hypothetical protein